MCVGTNRIHKLMVFIVLPLDGVFIHHWRCPIPTIALLPDADLIRYSKCAGLHSFPPLFVSLLCGGKPILVKVALVVLWFVECFVLQPCCHGAVVLCAVQCGSQLYGSIGAFSGILSKVGSGKCHVLLGILSIALGH